MRQRSAGRSCDRGAGDAPAARVTLGQLRQRRERVERRLRPSAAAMRTPARARRATCTPSRHGPRERATVTAGRPFAAPARGAGMPRPVQRSRTSANPPGSTFGRERQRAIERQRARDSERRPAARAVGPAPASAVGARTRQTTTRIAAAMQKPKAHARRASRRNEAEDHVARAKESLAVAPQR